MMPLLHSSCISRFIICFHRLRFMSLNEGERKKGQGQSLLGDLTFPSITETHELVVLKSIPIMSFPAAFALKGESSYKYKCRVTH